MKSVCYLSALGVSTPLDDRSRGAGDRSGAGGAYGVFPFALVLALRSDHVAKLGGLDWPDIPDLREALAVIPEAAGRD